MNFVYDVILNFTDVNTFYEMYEWKKDDHLVNVKKAPLFKVGNKVIIDLINNAIRVDKEFLNSIRDKNIINRKEKYSYIAIFSSSEKSIGICFNNKGFIMYKSAFLYNEENEINEIAKKKEVFELKYKIFNNNTSSFLREDYLKVKYVLNSIKSIYEKKNYNKLRFIYYDIFEEKKSDNKEIYNKLLNVKGYYDKLDKVYRFLKLGNKMIEK